MKKFLSILMVSLVFVTQILTSGIKIKADNQFSVNVVVESYDKVIAQGTATNSNAFQALNELLNNKGIPIDATSSKNGVYINSIDSVKASTFKGYDGWMYAVNRNGSYVDISSSIDNFTLQNGDELILYYGDFNTLTVNSLAYSTRVPGTDLTISLNNTYTDYTSGKPVTQAVTGLKSVKIDGNSYSVTENKVFVKGGLNIGKHSLEVSDFQASACPKVVADKINFDYGPVAHVRIEGLNGTIAEGDASGSNALNIIEAFLKEKGISYTENNGYISMIDNLSEKALGAYSGWEYYVKSSKAVTVPDVGMSSYIPKEGDNIIVYYTDFSVPILNKITFNPGVVQENKQFTMRFSYNHYDWNSNKTVDSPIVNAKVVIDDLSPMSTDSNGLITLPYGLSLGKHSYRISGYIKDQLSSVVADEGTFIIDGVNSPSIDYSDNPANNTSTDNTKLTLNVDNEIQASQKDIQSIANEWTAVSEKALGQKVDASFIDDYSQMLGDGGIDYLLNTDIEKMIIGLPAAGYSPYNFEGINLVKKLYSNPKDSFLINDSIFGLIAYNYANIKGNYPISRQDLINMILSNKITYTVGQQNIVGWAYGGNTIDPDMTGMAISALAPYYGSNSQVKQVVDSAVDSLSFIQNESGYITGPFGISSESISFTMIGLVSVGVDPAGAKFTKAKGNLTQALSSFKASPDGFKHSLSDTKKDQIATEEAYRALVAYKNYKVSGKYNLYSSNINSEALPAYTDANKNNSNNSNSQTLPATGSAVNVDSLFALGFILLGTGGITLVRKRKPNNQ